MEALLRSARVTEKACDFVAPYAPSVYNLDSSEVNARRMAAVTIGALLMSKRGMWCQPVNDNFSTGTIEPHVNRFVEAGGTIKLNCEVRRIIHNETRVEKLLYQDLGKGTWVICPGCGCTEPVLHEGFCKKCVLQWTMSGPNNPAKLRLEPSFGLDLREVTAKYYMAAV